MYSKRRQSNQKLIKDRKRSNLILLKLLKLYCLENPDIRFGQALCNLNIVEKNVDPYFLESSNTLHEAGEQFRREVPGSDQVSIVLRLKRFLISRML